MNFSIEHIAVPAANPAALKNWYVRVLGAKPICDNGQNPPVCLVALSGAWLEIYAGDIPSRTWQQQAGGLASRGIARGFPGRGQGRIDPARSEIHGRSNGGGGWRGRAVFQRPRRQFAAPGRTTEGLAARPGVRKHRAAMFGRPERLRRRLVEEGIYSSRMAKAICCTW